MIYEYNARLFIIIGLFFSLLVGMCATFAFTFYSIVELTFSWKLALVDVGALLTFQYLYDYINESSEFFKN